MIHWPGVGTYSRNLLSEFSKAHDLEIVCFCNSDGLDILPAAENFARVRLDQEVLSLRNLDRIGQTVNESGCDLFHAPYLAAPGQLACPLLVTVHDTIPLLFRRNSLISKRREYQGMLFDAVKKADHIVTVSGSSQNDITSLLELPQSKVTVIHNGVSQEFGSAGKPEEKEALLGKYQIREPYILWLGTYVPHKNINSLLEAYALLPDALRSRYSLVLAGEKSGSWKEARRLAKKLRIAESVNQTGYIEKDDLPSLYAFADLFCFPSTYEGFGLPPLEAMASGTPVVCSNLSSLPEVVGDAGVLVEPEPSTLSRAIADVLADGNLRRQLSAKGRERVKKFTWDAAAARMIDLYRGMAQTGGMWEPGSGNS